MNDIEFEAFARLMRILLDGWPLNDQRVIDTAGRRVLFALLHREAHNRGYGSWLDALNDV